MVDHPYGSANDWQDFSKRLLLALGINPKLYRRVNVELEAGKPPVIHLTGWLSKDQMHGAVTALSSDQ